MEIQQFINRVKACQKKDSYSIAKNLKVYRYSDAEIEIREEKEQKICSKCGNDLSKNPRSIKVLFNNSNENLTIFQVEILFDIFVYNRIPLDYANYHKCEAGRKFIENIKEIK